MSPTFTICLLFTCCFLERWSCVTSKNQYSKPSIEVSPGHVIARGRILIFRCTTQEPHGGFKLYKNDYFEKTERTSDHLAEFHIVDIKKENEGTYKCYYFQESNEELWSDSSDGITITVQDTNTENPDQDKAGNSTIIITSIVCSALLVIGLIFSAICYNKSKRKKVSSDIQKRNLPQSEEEPAAVAETMYATITSKLDPYSTIISDVGQQEGDEAKGELAYATLNKEALERKEPLPYSRKSETTLYATVNMQ